MTSSVHNIFAYGSYIQGTNGTSNAIVPMSYVFCDSTTHYVYQGGGREMLGFIISQCLMAFELLSSKILHAFFQKLAAFVVYLEPQHAGTF